MRVKVGETWYDPKDTPICIELTIDDKIAIASMKLELHYFSAWSDGMFESDADVLKWIGSDEFIKKWKANNE